MKAVRIASAAAAIAGLPAACAGPEPAGTAAFGGGGGGGGVAAARAFLDRNCIVCHDRARRTADLALDRLDPTEAPQNAEIWEKVIRKLRGGAMPPADRPRPDARAVEAFVSRLEADLDADAARRPMVGRPAARRLNRTEYANAVRDLLGLEVNATELLPPDDAGHGFDNIGLTVSPLLLERYLAAAGKIARLATGSPAAASTAYQVSRYLRQNERMGEDLPFGSRGGLAVRHTFPATGEYLVRLRLLRNHRDQVRGIGEAHDLEVRLDGERLELFTIGLPTLDEPTPDERRQYTLSADEGLAARFRTTAGTRLLSATFLAQPVVAEGPRQPPLSVASYGFSSVALHATEEPALSLIEIEGPLDLPGPDRAAARSAPGPGDTATGGGSSSAAPGTRPTRPPALAPSSRGSLVGRSVARSRKRISNRCSRCSTPAGNAAAFRAASSSPSARCSRAPSSCSASRPIPPAPPPERPTR